MTATTVFDHGDPTISATLYEWCRHFQAAPSLGYSDAHGGFYIASRHDDIATIAKDTEHFSSAQGITIPPLSNPVPSIPAESDPPMQRHYRAALQENLTPGAVRRCEDAIRALVTEAIDAFIDKGKADLITDLAAQIPTMATAQIFGFNRDNAVKFDRGFRAVVEAAGADVEHQMRVIDEFIGFLKEQVEQARVSPGDDVVSAIVNFDADGRKFTEEECLGLLWSVAGAATDTTRHAIGHTLYHVHENPDVRRQAIDDPSVIPSVIEECLRLEAPAFMTARVVVKDVTVAGTRLLPGDRVLLVHGWANRDEATFPNAGELVLGRKNVQQHNTFGKGVHTCLGMHLARLEVKLVLEQVLQRLPDYQLTGPLDGPKLAGGLMWGFESLPAEFTPGTPTGEH